MNIMQVVAFALVCSLLLTLLRQSSDAMALVLAVAASAVILTVIVRQLPPILTALQGLAARAGVEMFYLRTLLRVMAVAYVVDFGAHLCSDAGEGALAKNVRLAGKVLILAMAVPIIIAVADVVVGLLDQVIVQ